MSLIGLSPSTPPKASDSPHVFDVAEQDFARDVMEASMTQPIIVDFWAPWCGPCKDLGPAIESAVDAAGGAVKLAKVNIDENQQLSAQLRIQSIPMVYAFYQGQPVDGFQGNLPASEVQAFVQKIVAAAGGAAPGQMNEAEIEAAIAQAEQALSAGQIEQVEPFAAQLVEASNGAPKALALMGRVMLLKGDTAGLNEFLEGLDEDAAKLPEILSLKASMTLAAEAEGLPPIAALEAQAAATPDDMQTRFDLAKAQVAGGQGGAAIETLIAMIAEDAEWNDGAAKAKLFQFFDVFGPANPLTMRGRRKLSSLLFS